jgi:hypothetical protein
MVERWPSWSGDCTYETAGTQIYVAQKILKLVHWNLSEGLNYVAPKH